MTQRTFRQLNAKFYSEMAEDKPKGYCKDCKHRQRWQCNTKVIQYCGITKSNRTFNGLKKIKVYMGCDKWEAQTKYKKEKREI